MLICVPSVDGERHEADTAAGCSCRMGAVADWHGIAVRRYNTVSHEGSVAECEKHAY